MFVAAPKNLEANRIQYNIFEPYPLNKKREDEKPFPAQIDRNPSMRNTAYGFL